jgi:hypothetical protein
MWMRLFVVMLCFLPGAAEAATSKRTFLSCVEDLPVPDWGPGSTWGFEWEDTLSFRFVVDRQRRAKVFPTNELVDKSLRELTLSQSLERASFRRECIGAQLSVKYAFRKELRAKGVQHGFVVWGISAPDTVELRYVLE